MPRADGRANNELRPITLSTGYNKHAEGSCLAEFGDTVVLCTASVANEIPRWMYGQHRGGWVTAEYGMIPRATSDRTPRARIQQSGRTYEIQRLVGRALRAVVDMPALGERTITLDCDVLQADGGTRTAAVTGAYVAMIEAMGRMVKANQVKNIPIFEAMAAVSVGIVNGEVMLDLAYSEDSTAGVDMNVIMTASGKLVEVQGTAEGAPFTRDRLNDMLDLATAGIKQLIAKQREALAEIGL